MLISSEFNSCLTTVGKKDCNTTTNQVEQRSLSAYWYKDPCIFHLTLPTYYNSNAFQQFKARWWANTNCSSPTLSLKGWTRFPKNKYILTHTDVQNPLFKVTQ